MTIENPYEAPASALGAQAKEAASGRTYGGIGRGAYLGLSILVVIVAAILEDLFPEEAEAGVMATALAQLVGLIVIAGQRIKNMGQNPWWGLSILVPLYNLIVVIRCLAYPEGWADHRKLDTTGKIVGGLVLGFILLVIGGVLLATLFAGKVP